MCKTIPVTGRLAAALVALALSAGLWSCAPAARPGGEAPDAAQVPAVGAYPAAPRYAPGESPFGPHRTLKDFLRQTLARQYYSLDNVYSPPPDGFESMYFLQLEPENAVLHLATDAVRFRADERGAAVALGNGNVFVWSDWPCPGVTVPGNKGVDHVSFHSTSPYMAVFDNASLKLRVFDLRLCGEVFRMELKGDITDLALSPNGGWLALVDEAHNLWLGPVRGPLKTVARLRYLNLALEFTPQDGVLMAVDQAGWVTLWATHAGKLIDRFLIAGGPFDKARFKGARLHLAARDGVMQTWDLSNRQAVAPSREQEPFYLENGVLYYRTWEKHLLRKMHLGRLEIAVWQDPATEAIRVRDLDGKERFYSARDGVQTAPVESAGWRLVELDEEYGFKLGGRSFKMADSIFQKDRKQLFCRYVPGNGFFLWWRVSGRHREFDPFPGQLPVRSSLDVSAPLSWQQLTTADMLP